MDHIKRAALVFVVLAFLASGCLPTYLANTPQISPTSQPVLITATPASLPSSAVPNIPTPAGVRRLKIWVPAHLNPAENTPAARLLQERLNLFTSQHEGLTIEVRVKAISGPGGLLDSLVTASAAAPLALPDLIALPRDSMETAALKGLLHSFDNQGISFDDSGWYEYARQLARIQNSIFGLPFAGDALVVVYRQDIVSVPPVDWPATYGLTSPFVYPAADPHALYTLALYQSRGGELRDADGRPYLDAEKLAEVFEYYAGAEERGVMPYWITQYQSDAEVWRAFLDHQVDLIVTWLSQYLNASPEGTAFTRIPSNDGQPFTFASGWVWSMPTHPGESQDLGIELAKFLSEDLFLAGWTEALKALPTQTGALEKWTDSQWLPVMDEVAQSASLIPATDVLTSLGIPVQQAAIQVLKKQVDPESAAKSAADSLTSP